jgi:hypothetical protein
VSTLAAGAFSVWATEAVSELEAVPEPTPPAEQPEKVKAADKASTEAATAAFFLWFKSDISDCMRIPPLYKAIVQILPKAKSPIGLSTRREILARRLL